MNMTLQVTLMEIRDKIASDDVSLVTLNTVIDRLLILEDLYEGREEVSVLINLALIKKRQILEVATP